MGEAKRKRAAREAAVQGLSEIDIARVAAAVRWLFSAEDGTDCVGYAMYGAHLLQLLGVAADVAVGYSAWRVGDGPLDVIAYHPDYNPQTYKQLVFHAWIQAGSKVIDFTTHDLSRKRSILDLSKPRLKPFKDTTVTWCPDYLVAEKHEIVDVLRVKRGAHPPLFYYERLPIIEARFRAEVAPPKPDALSMLWTIYSNPDVMMFGPSNVGELKTA
jgi:hypothetical protein